MLLQHIKLYDNIDETLFVTADDLYFAEHKLIDLAMDFYQHGGKTTPPYDIPTFYDSNQPLRLPDPVWRNRYTQLVVWESNRIYSLSPGPNQHTYVSRQYRVFFPHADRIG